MATLIASQKLQRGGGLKVTVPRSFDLSKGHFRMCRKCIIIKKKKKKKKKKKRDVRVFVCGFLKNLFISLFFFFFFFFFGGGGGGGRMNDGTGMRPFLPFFRAFYRKKLLGGSLHRLGKYRINCFPEFGHR